MLAGLRDPEMRRTILAQEARRGCSTCCRPCRARSRRWDMYLLGDPPDYEPPPESSIAAMAERAGATPAEFCYDYLVGGDGGRMVYFPSQLRAWRPRVVRGRSRTRTPCSACRMAARIAG
jgi:N-acyl-D-aspartate/D-glutamate deacylase